MAWMMHSIRLGFACCLGILAFLPAAARAEHCVRIQSGLDQRFFLVNDCDTVVDVSVCVLGAASKFPCFDDALHITMQPGQRRFLWDSLNQPADGEYLIVSASCRYPLAIHVHGSRPFYCGLGSPDLG